MIGLKSYLHRFPPVGLTTEMLYERQRALVRSGELSVEPGRGPGSGVRADVNSISVFLISLLAHDLLVEVWMTQTIGVMKSAQDKCPLTGKKQFRDALKAILSDENIAQRVTSVTVNRSYLSGVIEFVGERSRNSRRLLRSEFAHEPFTHTAAPTSWNIETIKSVKQNLILQVAKDIAAFSE
jgi:hypothetical protein